MLIFHFLRASSSVYADRLRFGASHFNQSTPLLPKLALLKGCLPHLKVANITTKILFYFSERTMDPFVEYLQRLKSNIPIKAESVAIVMGNESCDLDSTVGSLSLAYFLNQTKGDATKLVLPLLNVLKSEFPLRTENIYVLNNVGIKEEYLLYRDTLDMDEIKRDKNLDITMVDHNVLSKHYEFLHENVKWIIDHRPLDANFNWNDDVIVHRKLVGSCCSLIAEEIFRENAAVMTPVLAKILYETIIFDTIGLSEEAGKVKYLDITMCRDLEQYLPVAPNTARLFDELWAAHNDVSNLSPSQLLAKDLKVINNILIPALPMLVKEYLRQCDVLKRIQDFCIEKHCDHVILMGLEAKGLDVKRDIAFFSCIKDSKLLEDIIEKLKGCKDLELQEDCSNVENIRYFTQNPKLSRKQIVPQVQAVLQKKLLSLIQLY